MQGTGADDLTLLRAHEPVVRLTKGERFVPVAVNRFVARARPVNYRPGGSV